MKALLAILMVLAMSACAGAASPDAQQRWRDSFCRETYGQSCSDQNGNPRGAPDHNQPMGDV